MPEPEIPQRMRYAVDLEPGEYRRCARGRSRNQPFCDGSRQGTGFSPVKLEIGENSQAWLCRCKHSHCSPFCDGSHTTLDA